MAKAPVSPPALPFDPADAAAVQQRFSLPLLQWYAAHARDLPWRQTRDPYLIWLSEVILQQTRVAQGQPYFEKFAAAYPTVEKLADAAQSEVLRLWQGLGYYSRARNLLATAQQVMQQYAGVFPSTYNELIALKGIGPYTAAAIAAFSSNEQVAVVDGNVYRVLARWFGLEADIATTTGKKTFAELAPLLVPPGRSHDYNQAIMEFGALHCVPANPLCPSCPVQDGCVAFATGRQNELPVNGKQQKVTNRWFTYVQLLGPGGQTLMRQRTDAGIWQGLFEPVLEEGIWDFAALPPRLMRDMSQAQLRHHAEAKHLLSHQRLHIRYMVYETASQAVFDDWARLFSTCSIYALNQLDGLPKPIIIHNLMQQANLLK